MDRAEDATGRASRAATLGAQAYNRLKDAVYGYATLRVGQQIIAEADAYTNLNSKLRLVTESQEQLVSVRQRLFDASQSTRSDFVATAELYARLTRSTEQLWLAESQRLSIVRTINQAMIVSGATAQESTAAIIQLSQGLASGALRGEEFNSVAEQAPILLDLVAESLGVTRGELRAMAADGKITADVLAGALLQGATDVEAKFRQMAPTVSGAAQQVKNAWTLAIGELFGDSNTALAEFLTGFAEGLAQLPETLRSVITDVIGYFDLMRVGAVESVGLLALGFAEAWERIKRGAAELAEDVKLVFAVAFDAINTALSGFYGSLSQTAFDFGLGELGTSLRNVSGDFKSSATATKEHEAAVAAANAEYLREIGLLDESRKELTDRSEAERKAIADASDLAEQTRAAGDEAEKAAGKFRRNGDAAEDQAEALKKAAQAAREYHSRIDMANAGDEERTKYLAQLAALQDRQTEAVARSNRAFDDHIRSIRDETRLLLLSGEAREEAERKIQAEAAMRRRLNELMQAGAPFLWALAQAQQAYNIELDALSQRDAAAEFDRIRQAVDRLGDAMSDAIGDLLSGGTEIEGFFERLGRNSQQFWSDMISDSIKAGESLDEFLARATKATSLKNPDGTWSMGGIANAVGSGANLYQAYRAGDPLSGAMSGAQLGMSIGSIIPGIGNLVGGIVGGIVGLVAGLFGGNKAPDLRLGATGIVRKPEDSFSTAFGSMQIGVRGGTNASEFIKLVTEFDAGMADLIGTFRNGAEQLDAVKQALSRWSVDMKGEVSAEEVLASRFNAILATFGADVQAFVGATGTLEERVQRLGEAAFIDAAAASGELLDSFGPLATLLTDYRQGNEDLGQTYARLLEATTGLEAAFQIIGVQTAGTREEFVRFAADVAESAGGVQQAAALWSAYFETFYDADETREIAQARALSARNSALQAIGLEATISAAEFRTAFEAALPSLTPDEIVQWLRAGAAIGAYNTAVQASADAAEEAAAPLRDLLQTLDGFAAGLDQQFTELARSGLSEFQRQMLEIDDDLRSNVAQLQAWRSQLVANGASAADLARVDALLGRTHELAAAQAARAITMLRNAGRSLVQQLMGGGGGSETSTVTTAAQGMADAGVSAFQTIGQAAEDLARQQLSALERIRDYLDAQLLGGLTSLTPGQQYAEAQSQFAAALAAAQGGDVNALANITQIADTLLRLSRERFAGGGQFLSDESFIRQALQGLLGLQPAGGTGAGTPLGVGNGMSGFGGFGLQQATTEFGQQATENRMELAQQISEVIRDLLQATGDSLSEVAASLGLNLNDLVAALGINLTDLSVQTATSLANVASTMGVELTDLAQQVGIELGQLGDTQSLLNDAVEAAIGELPDDQRDRLKPLLDAVEQAAAVGGPELVEDAILALEAETRRIGGAAASALAPYLAGIDPTDPLITIDGVLRQQLSTVGDIYTLLQQYLVPTAEVAPLPPQRQAAPSRALSIVTPGPVPSAVLIAAPGAGGSGNADLLAEMRAMRAEMAKLRAQVAASGDKTAAAVVTTGQQQTRATEQQTRELTARRTTMA